LALVPAAKLLKVVLLWKILVLLKERLVWLTKVEAMWLGRGK
jgi:hypothetical protein